jgi:hypothetical protein
MTLSYANVCVRPSSVCRQRRRKPAQTHGHGEDGSRHQVRRSEDRRPRRVPQAMGIYFTRRRRTRRSRGAHCAARTHQQQTGCIMPRHQCRNAYHGEGARGGCFVEIEATDREGIAYLHAGWSCVIVHQREIPVSWLSEIIAIATAHKGGVAGFLREHSYPDDGGSYALMVDPAPEVTT